MTIRKKLMTAATDDLEKLINDAEKALAKIASDSVSVHDLCKLIAGGERTKSIRQRCLRSLISKKEAELLKLYNDQHPLPLRAVKTEKEQAQ